MSIRQGRPEDYSKGPYLIVLDVAPCPLTSLLCLSNPRESLPLPYPSTCRSSFAPLLSFLVIAGRVCSRFETSRRELIPSCAFPIQSFLLFFFFSFLFPFLLLLPVAAVLSYPTRRETTRIEEIAFPSPRGTEFHPSERNFRDGRALSFSPPFRVLSTRRMRFQAYSRCSSLSLPLSSRQLCNAFYLFTKANTHLPWRHG